MTLTDTVLALSNSLELSLLLKATVLLAVALTIVKLAGRARASVRHLVMASAFATLATLPLVVAAVPAFRVDVPVQPARTIRIAATAPRPVVFDASIAEHAVAPKWVTPSWTTMLRVLWAAGAMHQLGFLGWQLLRLRRIQRAGVPWLAGRDRVRALAAECGVSRTVEVLRHEEIQAPVTSGVLRPVILLPFSVQEWNEDDLRRALIHEMEHVRRSDWVVQQFGRVAVACYWFHPLARVAWRTLCLEAERAADDAVLRTSKSTEYAAQLVGLAQSMRKPQAHPVLGMANRSDLSARVSSMLDSHQRRGRAGFLAAAAATGAAALVLGLIGPLTAVAQSSSSQSTEGSLRRPTALDRALYEASEAGDLRDIDQLLTNGAHVNAVLRGDGTPLLGAARKGQLAAVTLLLSHGADPNVAVPGDGTALIAAAAGGHSEIVSLLLDRGADPNLGVPGDGNPLIMAASEGRVEVVSLLLGRGARMEEVVAGDENALCKAAEQGQLDVAKLLVSRGANVNVRIWVEHAGGREGEWRSPLIMARRGGHQAVIDFLIASGARQ